MAALFEEVAWLDSYPLLVQDNGIAVGWMGIKPLAREIDLPQLAALPAGEVVVADADGASLLRLSPLVTVARPTPEADFAFFAFPWRCTGGDARFVAAGEQLFQHDANVWAWFGRTFALAEERSTAHAHDSSPYLGLASYSDSDARRFVGREAEIDVFVNRLQNQPWVTLAGPSGAGKTSFLARGVLPQLRSISRNLPDFATRSKAGNLVVRPGPRPPHASAHTVFMLMESRVASDPHALGVILRAHAAATSERILLIVDQFEK